MTTKKLPVTLTLMLVILRVSMDDHLLNAQLNQYHYEKNFAFQIENIALGTNLIGKYNPVL